MRVIKFLPALILALLFNFTAHEARAQVGVTTLTCTPPATDPEIAALARALNYNLSQIYEYIYYDIDFSPTFGSKKGALGTYLDRRGNNFDQNVLFVTLLRQSCITANYRQGVVQFSGASVANLLGVQNDAGVLTTVLGNGAIPACVFGTAGSCPTSTGTASAVNISMVWTEATVNGTTYELDPSFKSYTQYTPIDLATATGYTQSAFLSSALSGSSSVSGVPGGVASIKSVNRTNITSLLNGYSQNLTNYIKSNYSSSGSKQILGGRDITNANYGATFGAGGTLYTDLPSTYETVYTVTVSDNADGSNPTISATLYGSRIGGRRLTVTYNASAQPVLTLEGQVLGTGAATGVARQTVSLTVQNPYAAGGSFSTNTVHPNIVVGGTYAVMLAAGELGRDGLTRHQKMASKLLQAGSSPTSEPVFGESLAAMGTSYLAQSARAGEMVATFGNFVMVYHEAMGIAGHNKKAAYVDFPGQLASGSPATTTGTVPDMFGQTIGLAIYQSSLESTAVTQLQKSEAVSTVRMFDYANTDGTGFILATPSNWASVKLLLSNWGASEISSIDSWFAANPVGNVIIPQNGSRTVGNWTGSGYYEIAETSTSLSMAYKISGDNKGGFGTGYEYSSGFASIEGEEVPSTFDPISEEVDSEPFAQGPSIYQVINSYFTCASCEDEEEPLAEYAYRPAESSEPINMLSGGYTCTNNDISVGSSGFPFGLTLTRSYDSSVRAQQTALGYGWRHNFMISAIVNSDSFEAFGDHNPLAAVPTVVAAYVMGDLMRSPTLSISNTVASSLSASWLMDQLVHNSVMIVQDGGTKEFIKIPTADGTGLYVPPPGDGSVLVVNADKTIAITDKSKNVQIFDAAGNVSSWRDPNGNIVTFSYLTTSIVNQELLQTVSNGMGRTLTFAYNGANQLTSVSDGSRTVSYAYDGAGNLSTFTDSSPAPATTRFVYDQPGSLIQIFNPSFPATAFMTNVYDDFGRVKTQADAFGNVWFYMFANGKRSQEVDPAGGTHVLYYDGKGNQTQDINQAGDHTTMAYDGLGRLVTTTYPNGDSVASTYDANNNILTKTTNPIPGTIDPLTGSAATPIVQHWTYDPTYNKVLTATDGLGNVTTTAYDGNGNPVTVTQPAVTKPGVGGAVSPVSTRTYGAHGLVATSTDPEGQVTAYAYNSTFDRVGVTADSGRLNLTTSYGYDSVGNVISTTDPGGNAATTAYDGMRRVTRTTSPAPFTATTTTKTYDPDGRVISIAQATGNASAPWLTSTMTYNAAGKQVTATAPDGTTQTTGYDTVGRVSTKTSSSGRQVLTSYDLASRVTATTDQVSGTLDPSISVNRGAVVREQRTYFPGGLLASLADGNGHSLRYAYDGFKRRAQVLYADHTTAAPDFDLHAFDANGNERVFQTRSGAQVRSTFDALNRRITKAPTGEATITYGYDYTGRLISAQASTDSTAYQISYDTAGRKTGESSPTLGWITATLDARGNTVSLTWPSTASYTASFAYDQLNRMTGAYEGSVATGVGIASYSYNTLSQRAVVNYGPTTAAVVTSWFTWTPANQLSTLAHVWNGGSVSLNYNYNQDHQRSGYSISDGTFLPSGIAASSATYTSNVLNQYTAVNSTAYSYDKRGNFTSNGLWTYGYDTENRLVSASGPGVTASYVYDPFGRRLRKVVNSITTLWASYGNQEIAEYSGPGSTVSLVRRFVYGPGLDEPVAAVSASNVRTYQFQDALGSVILATNAAGQITEKYGYTGYGLTLSAGANTAAFRYAGRRYDPELGLYFNRARSYSPTLGRFLQTDPIGTDGGLHLYAYVGNDPLNKTDPMGKASQTSSYSVASSQSFEEDDEETAQSSSFVFRGVNTSPNTVFNQGFTPKGDSMDLLAHALDSDEPASGYISTSTSSNVASNFGPNVYAIRTPSNAVDVNATLGSASPYPDELEMAVPGSISGNQIRGVTMSGMNYSILNPGYGP
jgi:RHS repeat-associated protein